VEALADFRRFPTWIQLNREALAQLRCEKQLVIVPDATHLFEEPGALEGVAQLARDWFERHFARAEALTPGAGAGTA
jgi:hypothetical protein